MNRGRISQEMLPLYFHFGLAIIPKAATFMLESELAPRQSGEMRLK